jgi:hypothetical protein
VPRGHQQDDQDKTPPQAPPDPGPVQAQGLVGRASDPMGSFCGHSVPLAIANTCVVLGDAAKLAVPLHPS